MSDAGNGAARAFSNTVWENKMGYCRAIRCGDLVFTSGTVAADESGAIQGGDSYSQSCFILDKLSTALTEVGAELGQTVKVSVYLKGLEHAEGFQQAFSEHLFGDGALVEIGLVAVVRGAGADNRS
jgi:enamine deaminase RidA (YjgF/YER057c/UK114 family)